MASAQLQFWVSNGSGGPVDIHHVCGDNWLESQLTFDTWGALTGSSCGIVQNTPNGFGTATHRRVDVSPAVTGAGTQSLGATLGPPGGSDTVSITTTEHSSLPKPKLAVSVQH